MNFALKMKRIVRQQTAFPTMEKMLDAGGNYRPTIECSSYERYLMAEEYDRLQAERGDERRAHRYVNQAIQQDDIDYRHEIGNRMNVNPYGANDSLVVYANQAGRDAVVLAVLGNQILVEYEMPRGSTAMLQFDVVGGKRRNRKNVAYKTCPKRWLAEMRRTGMDWEGKGQRGTVPFPRTLTQAVRS